MKLLIYLYKLIVFSIRNIKGYVWTDDETPPDATNLQTSKDKMLFTVYMKQKGYDNKKAFQECLMHIQSDKNRMILLKNKSSEGLDASPIDLMYFRALDLMLESGSDDNEELDDDALYSLIDHIEINGYKYIGYNGEVVDFTLTPESLMIYIRLNRHLKMNWANKIADNIEKQYKLFLKLSKIK